ncbi:MAG: hypothetical protein HYR96_02110 [Deltaproteobacteria bacterium]|nr:hypothetical protein [Deltaproteobacteria bacterium]MBI3295665.1 hypothetical protein [Deltaproteobacteria bacterium]
MFQLTKQLGPFLYVQLRTRSDGPQAYRVTMRRLYSAAWILGLILLGLSFGCLLFFRELEINRKLSERVLELETALTLSSTTRATSPIAPAPQAPAIMENATEAGPSREPTAATVAVPAPVTQAIQTVPAKMSELFWECNDGICDIRTYLIPAAPGTAEGSLALVLEEEISRIGGADPNIPARRQFVYYPGFTAMEEFDAEKTGALEKRHFRFARALPTNVQFNIGKLNQPIAINLYIFDAEDNLVHHERKPLTGSEP